MITLCLILTELNFPQTQAGDMDENKKNSHNALAIKISTDQRSMCASFHLVLKKDTML